MPAFQPYLPPGAAALRDLPPRGCHWPIGDVEQDGFRFCGAPNRLGRPYCAAHGQLALRRRR
ncbi:GcrA family cell cycle regulator [Lichenihabitans sp. Uapishka_5]|uniref:GcrA family cell cycle regulator n=1 Tax=Lichenihabitans sp. Uapishka_5 TaxID=3037302 RepID=UPI0029E81F0A|nr:GcrA family cell cycle regulator [Lichenihabitans sp. Uapishka_5]MDX7952793.1 GcrA family cell cycle regulator [Lichenihabitans sp. Uapishka_5]